MKFCLLIFISFLVATAAFAKKKPKEYNAIVYSDKIRYKGFIEKVSDKGITIDYLGVSKFIPAESISRIKVKRTKGLSQSVFISSAGGLIAGSALYSYEQNKSTVNMSAIPVIVIGTTLVSAGVGAIINSFTSVVNYKHVNEGDNYKKIHVKLAQYSAAQLSKK